MHIRLTTQTVQTVEGDALVVGAARKATKQAGKRIQLSPSASDVNELLGGLIEERAEDGEFTAGLGEMLTLHPTGRLTVKRVIVVGLGAETKVTTQSIRRASAIAARHLQSTGAQQMTLALQWESANVDPQQAIQAQVEGALLGVYNFSQYQSGEKARSMREIAVFSANGNDSANEHALKKGQVLAEAANFARDLINEQPSVLTPTELANRTSAMAQRVGIECEVFDKAKIEELGMGGVLAVTSGSVEAPKFIILRYRGAAGSDKQLTLVGKGITFDSGGLSLKTAAGMETMKGDMGGAAAAIGAMQAIATLKPAINITVLVPTCENMPSGSAYHPGDVLRIANGKTIEIVNTDAEGRLVLADALSYASKEGLSPVIDLATLTGGIVVALGNVMTGLFCNDEQLSDEIIAAGHIAGEKFWPMPLDDDYDEMIKSDIADIKQTGGRGASSVTAAKILQNFVGTARWAHLDIAGTSYIDAKKSYQEKGATGVGVRTLAELALHLAQ
ncbi:MAG TPA: leucyl aminopeptidase [Ktedonobacteraceae bacterium]|nr:leucyl aminopeptidase [Ktedonobacteraceae bacterium]